ncbi:MAG: Do family serine endopeptidase [Myxococcota bacterium]
MTSPLRSGAVLFLALMFSLPARAEKLWTEKSTEDQKRDTITVPTMAPLIKRSSAAVVNISTNAKAGSGLPPGHPDIDEDVPDLFKRFHGDMPRPQVRGMGTGFIIHPTGYIVTNAHVVEDAETIEVRLLDDDVPRKARVVGADPPTDLALLKIDGQNLPVLPLGDSDSLEVGDFVVAIGNPFGLEHSASFGMISAKGRRDISPSGRSGLYDFIQTDAAINPGNSGGPLMNLRGEVVGINSAINAAGQGIGFAVPINMAKALLPELKDKGKVTRSWLGVSIQKVTPELAQSFGLDAARGALVSQVVDEGPSAKAGVEPGDVIVEFDGKKVGHSADLPLMAAMAGVGKTVPLKLIRDGKERVVKVTLAARPDEKQLLAARNGGAPAEPETVLGVRVSELTGTHREKWSLPKDFQGVVVEAVERDSPAAQAGLAPGDIIVKLNGKSASDVAAFSRLARGIQQGQMVRLFVRRGDSGMFIAFRT